jgi:hypothetical protein
VAFGQITVRKLRKNPKTKDVLGIEFASGWDIINVAQAFSLPRVWMRKIEKSKFSFMYANATATVLYENSSKFDRVLGCIFYWFLTLTGKIYQAKIYQATHNNLCIFLSINYT